MSPMKSKPLKVPSMPAPVSNPIIGLGEDPGNNEIQKTGPIYSLIKSGFTFQELQLIELYLSRVNSHDPSRCTVHIDLTELAQCFGVKELRADDMQKRLARLGMMVRIDDPYNPKGITMVSLFTKAVCMPDNYGVWGVDLTCHPDVRKYIFNVENIGYFRYKLRSILGMHSIYSYMLFMYLEDHRRYFSEMAWEIDVSDLRSVFMLKDNAYPSFKVFNDRLLKLVYADLNNNTECKYSYKTVKRGRYVKAVRFILEPLSIESQEDNQVSGQIGVPLPDTPTPLGVLDQSQSETQRIGEMYSDPTFSGMSTEQLLALHDLACSMVHETGDRRDISAVAIVRQGVLTARARNARSVFGYAQKCLRSLQDRDAATSAAKDDAEKMEEINDKRAREDMERAIRLLQQWEDEDKE